LNMSTSALEILEQFRLLPVPERRELVQILAKELETGRDTPGPHRKVAEVAGKFRPTPNPEATDHDRWSTEAILASKREDATLPGCSFGEGGSDLAK
jgi:hypothetical protein